MSAEEEIAEAARTYVEARRTYLEASPRGEARLFLEKSWERLQAAYDAELRLVPE